MNDGAFTTLPDFRTLFEAAPDLYLVLTPELRIVGASDAYCRATKTVRADIVGRALFDVFPDNPDDPATTATKNTRASMQRVLDTRRPDAMAIQKHDIRVSEAEGGGFEERYWAPVNTPVLDSAGAVVWIIHRVEDVTETVRTRARAESGHENSLQQQDIIEQLRATGSFLEALIENLPGMLVVKSLPDCRYILVNRAAEGILGLTRADVIGKTVYDLFPRENADAFTARDRLVAESGAPVVGAQESVTTRTQGVRLMQTTRAPVLGKDGKPEFLLCVYDDITDRKQVEQQLRQAVKMEAVGQLTGGVAHDFNNLLGIIVGNLDIAAEHAGRDPVLSECIEEALGASLRGADLTRRLLAFSRNQPLHPAILDLNTSLPQIAKMLRRTLGEHIVIELHPGQGLWPVMADSGQIDEAVLNLAINARDAMPRDGTLVIETENTHLDADYAAGHPEITAGEYVQLSISDDGIGMTPETVERCFEPFFTTKGVEQGSGLGLSMVYGFVKQSGGHIKVYSEVGHGTTVKIYLPRALETAPTVAAADTFEVPAKSASELVLAVEDNKELRTVTVRQLADLGYRTLEAENAHAALAVLAANPGIALLFTDIVMPGHMTGIDLAREAQRLYPRLKVLLVSGYPARAVGNGFHDIKGVELLQKPYRKQVLAQMIRRILDR